MQVRKESIVSENLEFMALEIQISQHPGRVRVRVKQGEQDFRCHIFHSFPFIDTDGKNAAVNLCQSQAWIL